MTTTEAITQLEYILQNQSLSFDNKTEALTNCINEAVERYAKDRPKETTEAVTGNASGEYTIVGGSAVLTNFDWDYSKILQIEYPVGENPPDYLDWDDWELYESPTLQQLFLHDNEPAATETFNVKYTELISAVSEVRSMDEKAVLNYSAYLACLREAKKSAETSADGSAFDWVNKIDSEKSYETLGDKFKTLYLNHIFGDPDSLKHDEAAARRGAVSKNVEFSTDVMNRHSRIIHEDDA